jgi:hypothetical protein
MPTNLPWPSETYVPVKTFFGSATNADRSYAGMIPHIAGSGHGGPDTAHTSADLEQELAKAARESSVDEGKTVSQLKRLS